MKYHIIATKGKYVEHYVGLTESEKIRMEKKYLKEGYTVEIK